MAEVTLPVWIGILTGSPESVAGIVAVEALPSIIAGPFAGVLADRLNARTTMFVCDLLCGLLILSPLFVPSRFVLPSVYVVGFGVQVVSLLFNPSKNILIRSTIPEDQINKALGLSRTTQSAALVLGPVVGSGLLLWGQGQESYLMPVPSSLVPLCS